MDTVIELVVVLVPCAEVALLGRRGHPSRDQRSDPKGKDSPNYEQFRQWHG